MLLGREEREALGCRRARAELAGGRDHEALFRDVRGRVALDRFADGGNGGAPAVTAVRASRVAGRATSAPERERGIGGRGDDVELAGVVRRGKELVELGDEPDVRRDDVGQRHLLAQGTSAGAAAAGEHSSQRGTRKTR